MSTTSVSVEVHARTFYPTRVGPKVMFWLLRVGYLPIEHQTRQEDSDTGDRCHYVIVGVSDTRLRQIFVNRSLTDFSIIDDGVERPLTLDDLP